MNSLLPAGLHIEVAKACIKLGKNLVTTSYISEALQAKHQDAVDAGVTILNECGLDPGLDHLSAKKMIDSVKSAGDKVLLRAAPTLN